MIFLSSPTLLIKLICFGSTSKSQYISSKCYGFWSIDDPHQEKSVQNFCFFDQIRVPPLLLADTYPPLPSPRLPTPPDPSLRGVYLPHLIPLIIPLI